MKSALLMNRILISVIIPTFRDWDRLQLCLDALSEQTLKPDEFEIIVVNNDPSDQPPSTFKISTNTTITNEHLKGSYAARNKGIKHAKTEILAFTDSDCIPDKKWLESGVQKINHGNDMIAGKVEFFFRNKEPNVYEYIDSATKMNQKHYASIGFGATANLFVKRSVIEVVGIFNEQLKSGGDYEFGMRATSSGFKIKYSELAKVKHPARSTWSEIIKKSKRVTQGINDLQKAGSTIHTVSIRSFIPIIRLPKNNFYPNPSIIFLLKVCFMINIKKYTALYYRIYHG